MSQPKNTINILLLLAICILSLIVWFGQKSSDSDQAPSNQLLSTLSPEKITNINIIGATKIKARLEKRNTTWFMTHPINIEANAFLVNNVIITLNSKYSKKFQSNENNLSQFGLAPAKFTLQLNEHVVLLGDINSITKQRYIHFKDTLYLVPDQIFPILNGAPASFVSHSIVPTGSRITALTLPDFSIKKQNGKWLRSADKTPPAQLSQDLFVKFIDEWQLAQALYVSLSSGSSNSDNVNNAATSLIQLADGSRISIKISREKSGLQIYREDVGIIYHMHNEAENTLFTFPAPKP